IFRQLLQIDISIGRLQLFSVLQSLLLQLTLDQFALLLGLLFMLLNLTKYFFLEGQAVGDSWIFRLSFEILLFHLSSQLSIVLAHLFLNLVAPLRRHPFAGFFCRQGTDISVANHLAVKSNLLWNPLVILEQLSRRQFGITTKI